MSSLLEATASESVRTTDDPAAPWLAQARRWEAAQVALDEQVRQILLLAQAFAAGLDDAASVPHEGHHPDWLEEALAARRQGYWDRCYADAIAAANGVYGGPAGPLDLTVECPELPAASRHQAVASMTALWDWYAECYGHGRGAARIWTEQVVAFANAIHLFNHYTKQIHSEVIKTRRDGAITFSVRASVDSFYTHRYCGYRWNEDWDAMCTSLAGFASWLLAEMQGELVSAVEALVQDVRSIITGHQDLEWGVAWVSPHTSTHTVYRLVPQKGRLKITLSARAAELLSTWLGLYLPVTAPS